MALHTADLVGHVAIGDNLHILREFVDDESIDLIYLDPPFNSNRAYSLIFKDPARGHSEAQEIAFKDQWTWNAGTEARFRDLLIPTVGSRATTRLSRLLANQVSAFERTQMAAYLVEMSVRLVEMYRVLKPTGSLFLHCDPTASHYLKVVLDAIFDARNFRNEITWKRSHAHGDTGQGAKHFGRVTERLLMYSKSDRYHFVPQYIPYSNEILARDYRYVEAETAERYRLMPVDGPGGAAKGNPFYEFMGVSGYWRYSRERMQELFDRGEIVVSSTGKSLSRKRYLKDAKGTPLTDLWTDINRISPTSRERLGYPTQKPLALLERIIAASSRPGDLVLDPFCGCGTAIEAARNLGRRWIGIDITVRAVDPINVRFQAAYGEKLEPLVLAPVDEEAARRLAEAKPNGRLAFEAWALTLIGARKNPDRDRGVDGLIPFIGPRGRIQEALVSVKSGHNRSPSEVRDLVGAVHRERSPAGIFLTLAEPTKEMKLEAARATPLIPGIPRIQIITIRAALNEENPARPILPAYRQEELFAALQDESTVPIAELEDDLREAIAQGAAARAKGQRDWRARLLASITEALDETGTSPASREEPRSPRTSKRDRTGQRP